MPPEAYQSAERQIPAPPIQPPRAQVVYAGFWIRYLALTLDGVVLGLAVSLPLYLLAKVLGMDYESDIGLNLAEWVIQLGYFIVLTQAHQATLGKQLLGLYVVAEDGKHLSIGKIILRETVGKIISILILGIGYFMVGFSSRKQGLHDKMVGSIVVSDPSKRKTWAFVASIVLSVLTPILVIVGVTVLASLETARGKGADAAAKSALVGIRAQAELVYDMNYDVDAERGSYAGVCEDPLVANALARAEDSVHAIAVCNAEDDAYAAYIPLLTAGTDVGWCIDSLGTSRESDYLGDSTRCP